MNEKKLIVVAILQELPPKTVLTRPLLFVTAFFLLTLFHPVIGLSQGVSSEAHEALKVLKALLSPRNHFYGPKSLTLNKAGQKGWHTDYVVEVKGDQLAVGYCEYFSAYENNRFGNIIVHLGEHRIPLAQFRNNRISYDESGLVITCRSNRECISTSDETSVLDRDNKNVPGSLSKKQEKRSSVTLYLPVEEKVQKAYHALKTLQESL